MIYSNDPIEFCAFIPKNICKSLRAWVTEQMQSARTLIIFSKSKKTCQYE